jgi:dephospho-CoA kinase
MILIGLTGGIGSGKSEVARLLVARGAEVIDADQIVRELQQPGAEVYYAMIKLLGQEIVSPDKSLDRGKIAGQVFADESMLKKLNELVHPIVRRVMNERVESFRDTDKVVVLDIPLLVENPRPGLDGVLVVDLDTQIAIQRLVEQRQMKLEDAQARVAKQATREQRRAIAGHVIDNSGDRQALEASVDSAWTWIRSLK